MKGIRFYLEYASPADKRKGVHSGNAFAAFDSLGNNFVPRLSGGVWVLDGLGALFAAPNSPVASTAYAIGLLRSHCKRISEKSAREIHPALFERLDMVDD